MIGKESEFEGPYYRTRDVVLETYLPDGSMS